MPDSVPPTEAQKELTDMRQLCAKITQAYRIRMQCLKRRHQLLASISNDFNKVSRSPEFFRSLAFLLNRENKLLAVLGGDFGSIATRIGRTKSMLAKNKRYFDKIGTDMRLGSYEKLYLDKMREMGVTWGDLDRFLESMINFLNSINQTLPQIKDRMRVEENFLKSMTTKSSEQLNKTLPVWDKEKHEFRQGEQLALSADKTSEQFDAFLQEWENEMKDNEKVLNALKKVISGNKKMIRTGTEDMSGFEALIPAGIMAGLTGSPFIIAGNLTNTPALTAVGAGISGIWLTLGLVIGLAIELSSIHNESLIDTSRDKKLVRELRRLTRKKRFGLF